MRIRCTIKWMAGLVALAAWCQLETTGTCQTYRQVVPNQYENIPGQGHSAGLSQAFRMQQFFPSGQFPQVPVIITGLRYRRHGPTPFTDATAEVRYRLSTTSSSEAQFSAVFAENAGQDETVVFDGVISMSSPTPDETAPYPFEMSVPFTTSFVYHPSRGNLLVDHQVLGPSTIPYNDAAGVSGDGIARIYSTDPNATVAGTSDEGSDVIEFEYAPLNDVVFDPPGMTFTNSIAVAMYSGVPGGVVRFTTDGTEPGPASTLYTTPITLEVSAVFKAKVFVAGVAASDTFTAEYTRFYPPDIEFLPAGGYFTNLIEVVLLNNLGAGTIRYTTDNSPVLASSLPYLVPLNLTASATLRTRVFLNAIPVSDEFSQSYTRIYAFEDDGLPFTWRSEHFGPGFLTDPCAAADADCDNDGYTNADEYAQGTVPVDQGSAPQIQLSIRAVPQLIFTTVAGRSYRILRSTSVAPPSWQIIEDNITATASELLYVDATAPMNSFYQIELVRD